MNLFESLKHTLENEKNVSMTENGALGYQTTGHYLLDLNFATSSLRNTTEVEIAQMFIRAFYEDRTLAMKWLYFARDIRGGMGERRLFRVVFKHMALNNPNLPLDKLLKLIPEYGRYDDLLCLLDTPLADDVIKLFSEQLHKDLEAQKNGESVSLLAKWLPSVNTSSRKTRAMARKIAEKLGMSERTYRKTLASLRKYIDVVECKMSADNFGEIRYESVPSKANLNYRDAFLRHDEERRLAYLEKLVKGEMVIHSGTLYPHEIVHQYMSAHNGIRFMCMNYDETLEQLWKSLPGTPDILGSSIVVADGSASMSSTIGSGTCRAIDVANALAIYFAEKCNGDFYNRYITFSQRPQLVDLNAGKNLFERLQIALSHNEVANTDIYRVFELLLTTAMNTRMKQEDMPQNIIIISDMEFDEATEGATDRLFEIIKKKYAKHGYTLPRLVFWNVCSRTGTIPVRENELGVALVSGFSTRIVDMVMSNELDPYVALVKTLNTDRYFPIEEIMIGQ